MLPLLFVPASRQKPHQVQQALYPSAITGGPVTAYRCPLNRAFVLRLSRLNRFSNASPKPSSICACTSLSVSELLHKVNLYHSLCRRSMTSTASQPASKKSSGDFPVVRCTHVLSSSMSFPYGKIVTHFRWFVNGEILIYGYFTLLLYAAFYFYIRLCLYIHRHAIRKAMVVSVIPAAMLTAKRIV